MEDFNLDFLDIRMYLDEKGIPWATEGKNISSGWVGFNCPFCRDTSNHGAINLSSMLFSCWKCNKKGSALIVIMAIEGCSFSFAKKLATKYVLTDFSHLIKPEREHNSKVIFPTGTSHVMLPIHRNFLIRRKYDPDFVTRKYDLKFVGPTLDDNKFRLIIPVYMQHKLVTYVGRDVTGKLEVPYKNAPVEKCIIQAKHCLYNIDTVKDTAVIVEGIFDSWRIGDGALPSFGTQYTKEQLLLLKGLKRAFVMFDGRADDDGEAIRFAHKMANDLTALVPQVEVLELSEGDPDNLTEDEVWALRKDIGL